VGRGTHRFCQIGDKSLLKQISGSASFQTFVNIAFVVTRGEHDNAGRRDLGVDGLSRPNSTPARHFDVEQDNIGKQGRDLQCRNPAVTGLSHNLDVFLISENDRHHPTKSWIVVSHHDADHVSNVSNVSNPAHGCLPSAGVIQLVPILNGLRSRHQPFG
jgi:hypothetical protein